MKTKLLKHDMYGNETTASPAGAQGYPEDPGPQTAHSLHPDIMSASGARHFKVHPHKTVRQHAAEMHAACGLQVKGSTGPCDGDDGSRTMGDPDDQPTGSFVNSGVYQY